MLVSDQMADLIFSLSMHPDVMLARDKSYKTLIAGSEIKRIGGHAIRIASKKQIIAMKKKIRPLREKDRFDFKALQAL